MLLLAAQLLPVDFSCKLDDETPHPTVYLDHGHCLTLGQKDSLRLEHVMYDHLHIGLLSQHHCAPPCLMSLLDTCSFVKTCCLSRHNQVVHRVCSLRAVFYPPKMPYLLICILLCKKEWVCPSEHTTITGLGCGLRNEDKQKSERNLG